MTHVSCQSYLSLKIRDGFSLSVLPGKADDVAVQLVWHKSVERDDVWMRWESYLQVHLMLDLVDELEEEVALEDDFCCFLCVGARRVRDKVDIWTKSI